MHTQSTLLRLECPGSIVEPELGQPVREGNRPAEPSRKIAPTTMLYADVAKVSARKAYGRAKLAENSPAADAQSNVFIRIRPTINIRSPSRPRPVPPRFAAIRKSRI